MENMHKRKDTTVKGRAGGNDWAKHLKPFGKRSVAKAERRAARWEITTEMLKNDEPPERLKLFNNPKAMARLRAEKGKSVIPRGMYCYGALNVTCPYWDKAARGPERGDGYCWFLGKGDWDDGVSELWDQCKNCGVNDSDAPDGTLEVYNEDV